MRIFYVLYFEDELVRSCLEAIRLLCNPLERHSAHITVRGPYSRRIDIARINDRSKFESVLIETAGNFFESNQNTVFFNCSSPALKSIWNKPDYPFNPHVTVYDGSSRDFAQRVFEILNGYKYCVNARVGGLKPLLSSAQKRFPVSLMLDEGLLSQVLGEPTKVVDVTDFSEARRLAAIDRVCRHLGSFANPGQTNSTAVRVGTAAS